MHFNNPYFTIEAKLDLLSKWILVHSILYYELNNSIVSDSMFDNNCRQYRQMALEYPESFQNSKDVNIFIHYIKGSQNSTYDLQAIIPKERYEELYQIAISLINKKKGG